jgi:hypothetical protein
MTKTKNQELLTKVYESFCNNEVESARELFHTALVEMSRDIHKELMKEDELSQDNALETDMESDLADDLEAIHGNETDQEVETADAEEELSDELLGDESELDDLESEEGETEEEQKIEDEKVEEVEDRLEDLEDNFEELKQMFDALANEEGDEDVKESVDLEKVSVKKSGDIGAEDATGMTSGDKAKSAFSNVDNKVNVGGEAVAIGKGETHKGFDRQEAPKSKELGKFTNRVKTSKDVLKTVSKLPAKGEVGAGKSGIPVEGNVDSLLGSKK